MGDWPPGLWRELSGVSSSLQVDRQASSAKCGNREYDQASEDLQANARIPLRTGNCWFVFRYLQAQTSD